MENYICNSLANSISSSHTSLKHSRAEAEIFEMGWLREGIAKDQVSRVHGLRSRKPRTQASRARRSVVFALRSMHSETRQQIRGPDVAKRFVGAAVAVHLLAQLAAQEAVALARTPQHPRA